MFFNADLINFYNKKDNCNYVLSKKKSREKYRVGPAIWVGRDDCR